MANRGTVVLASLILVLTSGFVSARSYCKPKQECWPSDDEIMKFEETLSQTANVVTPDIGQWFWFVCESKITNQQR